MNEAQWIWSKNGEGVNLYADFLHRFNVDAKCESVELRISADSHYAAVANGVYIPGFQYSDYPDDKTYDTLDITPYIQSGENRLCLIGYCEGESNFSYRKGKPGVWFTVTSGNEETFTVSGENTLSRASKGYECGLVEKITPQLGFTFHYDASKADGWLKSDYIPDGEWSFSVTDDARQKPRPRPIQLLDFLPERPTSLCAQGLFSESAQSGRLPCGERMQSAALLFKDCQSLTGLQPPVSFPVRDGVRFSAGNENCGGIYAVFDLGAESSGYFTLDVDLQSETLVLIGFGEHLEDLRIRTAVGGRQFAAVYMGRKGRQRFTHYFKRFGCRYVSLHIYARSARIFYAGIRPAEYPIGRENPILLTDGLHRKIYETALTTLKLCMHEHYEDCPWREQALYALDARIQMLCGYYAFGEIEMPRESIRLLAAGLRKDGLLELCAPAEAWVTIPSFSLAWITCLYEYAEFSGDYGFVREMISTAEAVLQTFTKRIAENGFIESFTASEHWNFYEWSESLNGGYISPKGKSFEAPLQAFFIIAAEQYFKLCEKIGASVSDRNLRILIEHMRGSLLRYFWDDTVGVFIDHLDSPQKSILTQALMVCAGAVDKPRRQALLEKMTKPVENGLIPATLSGRIFQYQAFLTEPETYEKFVLEDIARVWGKMITGGATSFWETESGAADFEGAGSLCHGWSAVPVLVYHGAFQKMQA